MQNRGPSKFVEQVDLVRSGCYVRNPIIVGLKFDRAIVPLRSIDYHLEITNSLVNITLKQTYFNPIEKFLEVDFSLPLSPESSIYKFQAEFNNSIIKGFVKDKEVAKKEHERAKTQGRQAILATIDPLSRDIFNIEIGNIPPLTQFVVTISLLQEMKISMSTFYELLIPSKISPRYMNQVDGVVRYSETMLHKQGKSSGPADYKWSFRIDLKTTRKVIFFDTPSHSLKLINQNQSGTQTLLEMEKSQIPQKDFVFLYTTQDFNLPSYVLGKTDISTTIMLSFIPKFSYFQVNDAYKSYIQKKPNDTDIQIVKGQYIFLLDRSGSMGGKRIYQAKRSLILFLKSLPFDSYFNVVSFGSSYKFLFDKSQKTTALAIQKAIKEIQSMNANYGGTQIYDPLLNLLKGQILDGYAKHIFLLTDGYVNDTQGIIRMVKKYTKYCRVHSIGIGSGASLSLIEGCAKSGKGKHIMISNNENPSEKIIQLLQSTLTPVISKVNIKYETEQQIQSIVPNPKSIPYILKDEVVNFFITFKGRLQKKIICTFQYEDSVTKLINKSEIQVDPKSFNQPFVDKMAHLKVLRILQDSAIQENNIQDHMYYVKIKNFKQEAIDYSIKHQILSFFTAFSCIGEQLIDGQYQEYKDLGVHKIYVEQPVQAPKEQQQKFGSYKARFRYGNGGIDIFATQGGGGCGCGAAQDSEQDQEQEEEQQQKNKKRNGGGAKIEIGRRPQLGGGGGGQEEDEQEQKQEKRKSPQLGGGGCGQESEQGQKTSLQLSKQKVKILPNISPIKDKQENQANTEIYKPIIKTKSQQLVEQVYRLQMTDGSWSQLQLIQKLSENPNTVTQMLKLFDSSLVITKLVVKWLQKNHQSSQYRLIIKKALAWLKKKIKEQSIQENQLNKIEPI